MGRLFFVGLILLFGAGGCASAAKQVEALSTKAAEGDPEAQLALGRRYADGDGVGQDWVRAAALYLKSAETGNTDAQLALGMLHREGAGVAQDDQAALRWIRKAAEAGNPRARFSLGLMYEEGSGVEKDQVAAHAWLNLAAAGLPPEERKLAVLQRDWLGAVMTPAQVAEAQRLAREWAAHKP